MDYHEPQVDIDNAAGDFMPYYLADNGILFMGGKGDSSIKFFEVESQAPYMHYLGQFRNNNSQKGLAWAPKRSFLRALPFLANSCVRGWASSARPTTQGLQCRDERNSESV